MAFADPSYTISRLGIEHGHMVVDMGAGSGFYTLKAAELVGDAGTVYAVEVQKDLLNRLKTEAAHRKLNHVHVVWGNIEKIGGTSVRDALADRVIVSNVLFQAEDRDTLALEAKRILKSGGKVLVVDWSDHSALGPAQPVSVATAERLFEKVGFVKESSFDAGDHHYGLIFKKP
jgi:ubiquinone/menaquinone biosynthesis C-methylase UbiE